MKNWKRNKISTIILLLYALTMWLLVGCNATTFYKVKCYQEKDSVYWYILQTSKGTFYHSTPSQLNDFSTVNFSYTQETLKLNEFKFLYIKRIPENKLPDNVLTEIEFDGHKVEK